MTTTSDRLPGISFEVVRQPAATTLPRMDIAAFAGFAARGPVGIPVAVEDVVRFGEIFGDDLALAWNPQHGSAAYAHLPIAVREFFRNGGRRCWVLRLADGPDSARFRMPGMLRGVGGAVTGAAWARAASPGSWSDALNVHATLLRTTVPETARRVETDGIRLLGQATSHMLRLELGDGVTGFLPPVPMNSAADRSRAERDAETLRPAASAFWFRRALPGALPKRNPAQLHLLDGATSLPLTLLSWSTGATARFRIPVSEATQIHPGTWLRLDMDVTTGSRFLAGTWLIVDEVVRAGTSATLAASRAWRALEPVKAWAWAATRQFQAAFVAAELWVMQEGAGTARIADVALTPVHPRWFGRFPDDDALFAPVETLLQGTPDALRLELSRPSRFPLAAPPFLTGEVLLPLGLEALPRAGHEQHALTSDRSTLERDGLASVHTGLFLDPDLAEARTDRLLADAFHLEHGAAETRRLTGMHALLGIEEASLLAVPDAVQRTFIERDGADRLPPEIPAAPRILTVSARDAEGDVYVDWTNVVGASAYVIEHSSDPRFRSGKALRASTSSAEVRLEEACADTAFIRVRAQTPAGPTPWSNTGVVQPPAEAFDRCARVNAPAPELRPFFEEDGRLVIRWRGAADGYRLERAADPLFSAPEVLYEGSARRLDIWLPTELTFFRVAAVLSGVESPWSRTQAWEPPLPFRWEVDADDADAAERLLTIHGAMLRMCAARADMLAVLSLPPEHREAEALAHAAALAADPRTAGGDTGRVLSYGALYHPWLVVPAPGAAGRLRSIPPDGAICGLIAARALESGAWAVPANRPIAGVVALEPRLAESARATFFGQRVNAVAPFPEGFLVWSEETLSDDVELSGIGVRRLLILLRRLALREGTLHVFQPHSASFRRLVQRQFDRVLADLFSRGAFAGRQPEEGYRVVTSDAVNPAQSVEQGRLIVELRVAPSRPLHFLTVRLVQGGAGLSAGEA